MLRLCGISMFAFLSVGVLSRHWVYRGELWMKALILTDKDGRLAQDPTKPRTAGLLGVSACSGQSCFRILKWTLSLLLFYDLFYWLRPTPLDSSRVFLRINIPLGMRWKLLSSMIIKDADRSFQRDPLGLPSTVPEAVLGPGWRGWSCWVGACWHNSFVNTHIRIVAQSTARLYLFAFAHVIFVSQQSRSKHRGSLLTVLQRIAC